jgi:hypothetical protein
MAHANDRAGLAKPLTLANRHRRQSSQGSCPQCLRKDVYGSGARQDSGSRPLRVRRQSFWDMERLKLRESLARLVCNVMRLADGAASGGWRLSVV